MLSKACSMHSQSIAEVSQYGIFLLFLHHSFAWLVYTYLSLSKSFLLPKTKNGKFKGSLGMHFSRKLLRQLFKFSKLSQLVMSCTNMHASAPLQKAAPSDQYLSCPAVSHNCSVTVTISSPTGICNFFELKSAPIVGLYPWLILFRMKLDTKEGRGSQVYLRIVRSV